MIPPKLFQPGDGTHPPEFAGRGEDEAAVLQCARELDNLDAQGRARISANILLYGPRGNGKTVLFNRVRRWAEGRSNWLVLDMNVSAHGGSPRAVAEFIAPPPRRKALLAALSQSKAQVSGGGLGWGGGFSFELPKLASTAWRVDQALAAAVAHKPCLLMIDEAHLLPPNACAELLQASRMLRADGAPFLMALSGTPALQDVLSASGLSNWDRGFHVPLGRLPQSAALQALTMPLERHGVVFEDAKALQAVEESMNDYAFFTQLFGEAAVAALNAEGARKFDWGVAQKALRLFERKRDRFCVSRRHEVESAQCGLAAAAAWGALRGHGGQAPSQLVRDAMRSVRVPSASEQETYDQLRRLGVLWEAGKGVEAGIPSLMDSIVRSGGPEAGRAYAHGRTLGMQWAEAEKAVALELDGSSNPVPDSNPPLSDR